MQFIEGGRRAFKTSAAMAQYSRVYLNATGQVQLAGTTNKDIGVISRQCFGPTAVPNEVVDVILRNAPGTVPMIANGTINSWAEVYASTNGTISANQATGALALGTTLDAGIASSVASGALIEVLRHVSPV